MEFKPIETQEAFDTAIKERIKRVREQEAKKYADYDDVKAKLKEFEDKAAAGQTDVEKLAALVNEYKGKFDAQEKAAVTDKARAKVAQSTGAPASLIVGDDEESMKRFAESVAAFAKKPAAPVAPDAGESSSGTKAGDSAMRDFVRGLIP